jgi:hypothetical protein
VGQALRGGLGKLTALAQARRALRGEKGDSCVDCRAIGRQRFGADVCGRSGAVCAREEDVRAAEARLVSWEAREALRLWGRVQSQWRIGMAGAFGLDYVAAYRVAKTIGVEIDDDVLTLLQVLEAEQVESWSERAEYGSAKGQRGIVRRG